MPTRGNGEGHTTYLNNKIFQALILEKEKL